MSDIVATTEIPEAIPSDVIGEPAVVPSDLHNLDGNVALCHAAMRGTHGFILDAITNPDSEWMAKKATPNTVLLNGCIEIWQNLADLRKQTKKYTYADVPARLRPILRWLNDWGKQARPELLCVRPTAEQLQGDSLRRNGDVMHCVKTSVEFMQMAEQAGCESVQFMMLQHKAIAINDAFKAQVLKQREDNQTNPELH